MILILKTGITYKSIKTQYGDFEDWIIGKMSLKEGEYLIHKTENFQTLPPNNNYTGIVITGSHSMVTDIEPVENRMCSWLVNAHDNGIPILGICYGHQLLSFIFGGTVSYNGKGIVIGSENTLLTAEGKKDKLLGELPSIFKVYKAHKQSVSHLPKSAEILSINKSGVIDAFRFNISTWGVQFHPEFDQNITKAYINELSEELAGEGRDVLNLSDEVVDVAYGSKLLKRFKQITEKA
ncbi:glutamine amidotransferase [Zobellia laminariae]|uniref:glutamine amidotransferase n=1 Tax=Zobellia laminariae TaxID=248906 RepID=UPI0012D90F25|nr:glutamine amidotransferase [Zobellia laminariae]